MAADEPEKMIIGRGDQRRAIAFRATVANPAGLPGLLWLPGFMSDMASTKASALAVWAASRGLAMTRFDYSGHGQSGGAFTDGTIGRWLEEAREIFLHATAGPQIIVGSSMGGYIALLLLRALQGANRDEAARIKSLVLIAPAWDMTEELMWKNFGADVRHEIMQSGRHMRPSAYDAPYTITRNLIEDGRKHLLARTPFDPGRPVVILQGLLDPDVPPAHTRELAAFMNPAHVNLIEVPDGDHRLSRPQDIDLLFSEIAKLI